MHYLIRSRLTNASIANLVKNPQDRTSQAQNLIGAFKGKASNYFWAADGGGIVVICEFPSASAAEACALRAISTGGFDRFRITPLLTGQEAEQVLKEANAADMNYRAPNG